MRKLVEHMEKLALFVEVAQAKSFHKAAKRLRLSQPSLSQAVKILEETLDRKILTRSRRGVELTEAGQELFQFSQRLLSEVEGAESRIRFPAEPMRGSLHIGTFSSLMSYLWPGFLVHLAKNYGELTLSLSSLKADEISPRLLNRSCHFVVSSENLKQKTVTNINLYTDSFGFFRAGRKSAKNILGSPQSKADLKNFPLIYVAVAQDDRGLSLEEILREEGLNPSRTYKLDNFEAVRALTFEGLGIGILPLLLAKPLVESGALEPVIFPGLKKIGDHQISVSVLSEDLADPRVAKVLEELRTWCRKFHGKENR